MLNKRSFLLALHPVTTRLTVYNSLVPYLSPALEHKLLKRRDYVLLSFVSPKA